MQLAHHTNRERLSHLEVVADGPVTKAAAADAKVHRTTLWRWKKKQEAIQAAVHKHKKQFSYKKRGRKPKHEALEKKLYDWAVDMRKNKARCVTIHCLVLMIARYDLAYAREKSERAKIAFVRRMMRRRRLSVRRVTHRGKILRQKMHEIGAEFGERVRYKLEVTGLPSLCGYTNKAAHMYNMDQTGVYIDMNPSRTIDFVGAHDVDVNQQMSENSFRATVFLCASATGRKMPAMVVFAGAPNATVHKEVLGLEDGIICTVQKKAFTDERVMKEWISAVWQPDLDDCRLLLLDSLKVHKMSTIKELLEESNTETEFIPPGLTGICQPMDVAVMKLFKDNLRTLYLEHHHTNPFADNPTERRKLIARLFKRAWEMNGFVKCGLVPVDPQDQFGSYAMAPPPNEEATNEDDSDDSESDEDASSSEDEEHLVETDEAEVTEVVV